MRVGVVLENGVMMKDTGRKWLIVFSFVARGRSVGLHAIYNQGTKQQAR